MSFVATWLACWSPKHKLICPVVYLNVEHICFFFFFFFFLRKIHKKCSSLFTNPISFNNTTCMKVSQDVPKYMMVAGERPELRGLNLEGLRRNGFTVEEVALHFSLWFYSNLLASFNDYIWKGLPYMFVQGSRSMAWDLLTGRYSCLLIQSLKGWKNVSKKWYFTSLPPTDITTN